ncbi:HNH endonuclease [Antrihabitans cavernicola]|uniref:HNH endonuclease n=2 Tax=Antrihabitans cavernicola TaxID=2495913 RepID=A0A5A7SA23_9NOCA|nr:HNH endonuclease [Spelaeibacter cavernicola]
MVRAALVGMLSVALLASAGCALLVRPVPAPAPGSPTRAALNALVAAATVVPTRTHVAGYVRGCKAGQACVFGPAWSDDTDAAFSHDGCDTRNNVLAVQLTSVQFKAGTRNCVVVSGSLADPYSGRVIGFSKSDAKAVQIDHVYPLAAAWDMGAWAWPLERRMRFANDVDFNLLAVDGPTNLSKGDDTPAQWLPPDAAHHCYYAGKYLTVAAQYRLPISVADREVLSRIASTCGDDQRLG